MKDLPLTALRAFAAVVTEGGVRHGARRLGVAHSSISRQLRDLEAWLGVPLLDPAAPRQRLRLTPQGRALGRVACDSFAALADSVTALREARRPNAVVIATTASVAARWLVPRLPNLAAAEPALEVSVLTEQGLVDPDGQAVDLAIRMGRGPWPDAVAEPLMDDALYPVMAPGRAAQDTDRPAGAFGVGLPLLHDRDPQASWAAWFAAHPVPGIDIRRGPRFASSDLVLQAAEAGLGIALARHRLAAASVDAGALVRPCGPSAVAVERAYWLVLPPAPPRRRAVTTVIDWLRRQAAA